MTTTTMPLSKAITAGLRKAMEDDDKVVLIGEDIGKLGGVFRVTEGLQKDFGAASSMPHSRSPASSAPPSDGDPRLPPRREIQFDAFIFPAYDQIVTQVAVARPHPRARAHPHGHPRALRRRDRPPSITRRARSRFRPPRGPADHLPVDAARRVLDDPGRDPRDDPVMFFEPKRRYWMRGEVDAAARGTDTHTAQVVREGTDLTLVSYGPLMPTALDVVEAKAEEGASIELIDLRSLSPIDFDTIEASVKRTGRLVVAHEAAVFLGLGAEIAARITERCFFHLEAPVLRAGGFHIPYPPSKLESHHLPDLDRILDAVDRALAY